MQTTTMRALAAAAALTIGLILAGCSTTNTSSPNTSPSDSSSSEPSSSAASHGRVLAKHFLQAARADTGCSSDVDKYDRAMM